jgi:hypothetical protein
VNEEFRFGVESVNEVEECGIDDVDYVDFENESTVAENGAYNIMLRSNSA